MVTARKSLEMIEVRFKDVGRDKRCWTVLLKRPTDEDAIIRHVRLSGALRSRCVGVEFNPLSLSGNIYAGGRCVGAFEIVDPLEANTGVDAVTEEGSCIKESHDGTGNGSQRAAVA